MNRNQAKFPNLDSFYLFLLGFFCDIMFKYQFGDSVRQSICFAFRFFITESFESHYSFLLASNIDIVLARISSM